MLNVQSLPTLIANATYENTPANLNVTTSYATYSVSAAVDTASTKNIIVFIWSDVTDTTAGDFLYITDVQLEKGSAASDFEFLPIDVNLGRCFRYYEKSYNLTTNPATATEDGAEQLNGLQSGSKQIRMISRFKVRKRATPTITFYDTAGNSARYGEFNDGALTSDIIPGGVILTTDTSFLLYRSSTTATGATYHYVANGEL
jgi:hypothetical protein